MQLVIGLLLTSFSAILVYLSSVTSIEISLYRVFGGGFLLILFGLFKMKQPQFKQLLSKRFLFWSFVLSVILCVDLFSWHSCVLIMGPGLATLIISLHIIIFAIFGCVSGSTSFQWSLIMAIGLSLLGLFLIIGIDWPLSENYGKGLLFGGFSTICYTLFISILRLRRIDYSEVPTAINLGIIYLFSGVLFMMVFVSSSVSFSFPTVGQFLYIGAYITLIPFLAWLLITTGLPKTPITCVGFLLLIQPMGTYFWDFLLFKHVLMPVELIGFLLMILGLYLGAQQRPSQIRLIDP